jgi:hypothetical protein
MTINNIPLHPLIVHAAVTVLVLVVLTGDAGARAVWGTGGRNSGAAPSLSSVVASAR